MNNHDNPNRFGNPADFNRDGYHQVQVHELSTSDVQGATVYGHGEEKIGKINDLIAGTDGKISDAIVDVGGFLGLGAHSVKLPFSDLTILREVDGSDLRIHLGATKEQLEAMPAYQG
jgi:hypothetical protein